MDIAIIGLGNVGGALARNLASKGHQLLLGVRNPADPELQQKWSGTAYKLLPPAEAASRAEVIILALPVPALVPVLQSIGQLPGKVMIDSTNAVFGKPEPYATGYEAIKDICKADAIKCFNTTGFENMENPIYAGEAMDMYIAGGSAQAKIIATRLATEAGFGAVYDFGGDDKVALIEQMAMVWINLAIVQGEGRNIAFKLHRR